MPEFEFDPNKSRSNLDKHGIDFIEAQALWLDVNSLSFPVTVNGEMRALTVSRYNGKHWTAIYTLRGESIRIISVRRSRTKEIMLYENGRL